MGRPGRKPILITRNELPEKTIHELGAYGVLKLYPYSRKKIDERQLSFDFGDVIAKLPPQTSEGSFLTFIDSTFSV